MKAVGKTLGIAVVAFSLAFAITAANIAADRGAAALREAEALADAGEGVPVVQGATIQRSAPARFRTWRASSFGPGLYGNVLFCNGRTQPYDMRLRPGTIGIARRDAARSCGSTWQICYRGRCVLARVIDKGPFVAGRDVDLTEGLHRRAFGVPTSRAWGVRDVRVRCVRRCP